MGGKITEEAQTYIKRRVLEGETYERVASELKTVFNIDTTKQAVSYYVGKMGIRNKVAKVKKQTRIEQENAWNEAITKYMQGLEDQHQVTIKGLAEATGAPTDIARSHLIELGLYDERTFRERIDDVLLIQRYVVEDLSISRLYEHYPSVCISTLTQVLRQVLTDYGLEPRPKSSANNTELLSEWRTDMVSRLENRGWEVRA